MKCPGSGRVVRNRPKTCRCGECGLVLRPTQDRRVPAHWKADDRDDEQPVSD